jgi:hypoxanthine phosphoribosyltransferase
MSAKPREEPVRLRELCSPAEVCERIEAVVERLYRDYADSPLVLLVVAEGARRFAERLLEGLRARKVQPEILSLRARRTRGATLEGVQIEAIDPSVFEAKDVLVVEDIVDEGRTLEAVLALVSEGEPRSVRVAALVSKTGRRKVPLPLAYVGLEVREGWVVGFGMDLEGRFRELDGLAVVEGTR